MAITTFSSPLRLLLPHHSTFSKRTFSTRVATQSATPLASIPSSPPPNKKKVLVPVGKGTEEMEAVVLADVLRRAGADVIVASVGLELEVVGSSGTRVVADSHISKCADQVFDLVALPGGMPGSVHLRDCEILQRIMTKQAEEKRLYGAICTAPAIVLVSWGLHKGKKITGHPAFKDKLPTFRQVEERVQVSGEMTTSRGPATSFDFVLSFVEQLFGLNIAQEISTSLLMQLSGVNGRIKEFDEINWSLDHIPQVLVPVANGCEEMEIVILVDILRRARIDVIIASVEKKNQILGSQKIKIIADKSISEASGSNYDLIILPGGIEGTERLSKSRVLKKLLKEQTLAGKVYGGTHSSLVLLEKQGLLKDKIVAAHPCVTGQLTGRLDEAGVVIDGNLITAKGFCTVIDFSLAIVKKLFGKSRARCLSEGLVFDYK
ncbi:hypothetical protein LUZ60_002744 [Juncus effusus]|nr:hypothetical protein LUZ60_002744 [Juncus effusus]